MKKGIYMSGGMGTIEFYRKEGDSGIYYIGNPNKPSSKDKKVNIYQLYTLGGIKNIPSIWNYKLLIEEREKEYKVQLKRFIEEKEHNKTESTVQDFDLIWLENELIKINEWRNLTFSHSWGTTKIPGDPATLIELRKYSEYIENRIKDLKTPHIKDFTEFKDFFNESETAKKIIPFIKREYANRKPQDIAFLLLALKELSLLDYTKRPQTHLHKALENVLGKIGTRAALNIQLSDLRNGLKNREAEIKVHKSRITSFLKSK